MSDQIYPREFYADPTVEVAKKMIGARLSVLSDGELISGIITETEAYVGETDMACHAKAGITKRTSGMYGLPGTAYIYFTYGNHWMFCIVTEPEGVPAAVLVRAVIVENGLGLVAKRRGHVARKLWTDGPGKLTNAFGIDQRQHRLDLTDQNSDIWVSAGRDIPWSGVTIGPRVGLYSVPEPWKSIPWRFLVTEKTNLEDIWDY